MVRKFQLQVCEKLHFYKLANCMKLLLIYFLLEQSLQNSRIEGNRET